MSELVKVFENVEFGKIRVVIIDDEPWFVAKELSELLEYSETSKMLRRLDDDEIKKVAPTILGDSINPMVREMALTLIEVTKPVKNRVNISVSLL